MSSGNATHLNSLSMNLLTVGKKLGFPKFPERAFQALQSYLIKAIEEKLKDAVSQLFMDQF